MTVIFMDFSQNLSDHMPEKSDPIAHNGKQNVLVYRTWQNLLKFLQGVLPNEGTEVAVGGAASTKIRSNSRKLAKILIAERKI